MIKLKKNDENVEISYCSMFDNNAYRDNSREYTEEECNSYKNMLLDKHAEFYNSFWNRFSSLLEEFKSSMTKELNNWDLLSIYEAI